MEPTTTFTQGQVTLLDCAAITTARDQHGQVWTLITAEEGEMVCIAPGGVVLRITAHGPLQVPVSDVSSYLFARQRAIDFIAWAATADLPEYDGVQGGQLRKVGQVR